MMAAIADQIYNSFKGSAYTYTLGRPFHEYGIEQQAQLVQDWFARHRDNINSQDAIQDEAFRYIQQNIRLGETA